ncbi:unnamed protein product [Linum tenue]|uniref:HMA domain-containing protein n=1 Tax=Linum tenue TaxID=586396 RepID=A0AAV0S4U9_9ROSI|nr:unnamed protein product [Linum tenue]
MLKKIDGVYSVEIDAETQVVTVSGTVDSATLIKKLSKVGKFAELCSSGDPSNNSSRSQLQAPALQGQHSRPFHNGSHNTGTGSAGTTNPGNSNAVAMVGGLDNNGASLVRPHTAGFHGTGHTSSRFAGMPPSYELNRQPAMAIVNSQQDSYHNFPSADMNSNNYFGNSDMRFTAHQPLMMSHALSSQPATVPMTNLDYGHHEAAQQLYHYIGYQ